MSRYTDRLEKARQLHVRQHVVDTDPLVIQMGSESGDDEYTIVPNIAFCNCPDRQYRQLPCKHLLHLALHSGVTPSVRKATAEGIHHRNHELAEEIEELQARVNELLDRSVVWDEAGRDVSSEVEEVEVKTAEPGSIPEIPDGAKEAARKIDDGILGTSETVRVQRLDSDVGFEFGEDRDEIGRVARTANVSES